LKSSAISFILTIFSSQKCHYHKFSINFSNFLKIFIKFSLFFVLLDDFFSYCNNCSIVLKLFLFKHIYFSLSVYFSYSQNIFPYTFFLLHWQNFFNHLLFGLYFSFNRLILSTHKNLGFDLKILKNCPFNKIIIIVFTKSKIMLT